MKEVKRSFLFHLRVRTQQIRAVSVTVACGPQLVGLIHIRVRLFHGSDYRWPDILSAYKKNPFFTMR
jgi:hypothetical protein